MRKPNHSMGASKRSSGSPTAIATSRTSKPPSTSTSVHSTSIPVPTEKPEEPELRIRARVAPFSFLTLRSAFCVQSLSRSINDHFVPNPCNLIQLRDVRVPQPHAPVRHGMSELVRFIRPMNSVTVAELEPVLARHRPPTRD